MHGRSEEAEQAQVAAILDSLNSHVYDNPMHLFCVLDSNKALCANIAETINLGSSELIAINKLADMASDIGGAKLEYEHDLDASQGVAGRNSDNTMIKDVLGWEPDTPFSEGLKKTNTWIEKQYFDRKAGKRTVS